jgi:hypothetical protein
MHGSGDLSRFYLGDIANHTVPTENFHFPVLVLSPPKEEAVISAGLNTMLSGAMGVLTEAPLPHLIFLRDAERSPSFYRCKSSPKVAASPRRNPVYLG